MYEPIATPLANAVRGSLLRKSHYELPADLAHKHELSRKSVEVALAEAGFGDVSSRFHDFLAYPLTGMYIELPWSRSRALMAGHARARRALTVGALVSSVAT